MKALITGGAGFIGSHLAERLLDQGYEVTAIDDLSTGRMENLSNAQQHKNFKFVLDSVRNAETMHILVEQCDVIYHLAAAVGVQLIVDRPVHTIETNIHGSEVVLEIANKFRKKVLIASTSEVYGKSEAVPFREDDDTVLGSTRFSQYDLDVVVARLFNTVGPRQTGQYGMVVPRFVDCALNGDPIKIYGTGKQTRCFSYVVDVISGLQDLMDNDYATGQVYNIGSDQEISIEGLAKKIIELTGSTSTIEYLSYEQAYGRPFDDMMRRVPCLERLKAAIGHVPQTSLEEMLKLIITDIRK